MRVGRRSASRGLEPEIDLTGPPRTLGSPAARVLIAEPAAAGPSSTQDQNGTLVNGSEIAAGVRVTLHNGDRIHLGAWTEITAGPCRHRRARRRAPP